MAEEYGVFVTTPPPSETFMIARSPTREGAVELAIKWGGDMEWQTPSEAVSPFGEKVYIEEIKTPVRRGTPLHFLRWDEIFETGVFEKYMAPQLGFHLTKYGEVVSEERERWEGFWKRAESWLMNALRDRRIEPYGLQGAQIYPADLKSMIHELKKMMVHTDRHDWAPSDPWMQGLASALKKLLEDNK